MEGAIQSDQGGVRECVCAQGSERERERDRESESETRERMRAPASMRAHLREIIKHDTKRRGEKKRVRERES